MQRNEWTLRVSRLRNIYLDLLIFYLFFYFVEKIDTEFKTVSDLVERDGHRYMLLKSLTFDPTVGNMKFNAEGLLPEPLLSNQWKYFIYKFHILN